MIAKGLSSFVSKLRVRSALNPALWLCGIVFIPCATLASRFDNGTPFWIKALMFGAVGLAAIGFLFLLFFDRDKLQSEEYQLQKQSLALIEEKDYPLAVSQISKLLSRNPANGDNHPVNGDNQ